jgi:DNA invertase Pin-like site-specific DNA recombinase
MGGREERELRQVAERMVLFLHQQGLDTTTPGSKAMFQMMGVFAEFERAMIQERVRAGLRRARSEGKQLGRPKIGSRTADELATFPLIELHSISPAARVPSWTG